METYQERQVKVSGEPIWEITYTCSSYYGCITDDLQISGFKHQQF